jgi:N-acetylglucosaminyldiphosphoundecaprenol N-acetyl-beta-D-mannosaminyltransferase
MPGIRREFGLVPFRRGAVPHSSVQEAASKQPAAPPRCREVFGIPVHPVDYKQVWSLVRQWAAERTGRYVCFAAVATIIHARDLPAFSSAIAGADLILPDGMPVVWAMRRSGAPSQARLPGPDLVFQLCADAERERIPVGFLGSTPEILRAIEEQLGRRFPSLEIRYSHSPPFRPLTEDEESRVLEDIDRSGAALLFVGLGCPKQELWMARMRRRSRAVMFGIGGAFDIAAGIQRVPPLWVQHAGLQWMHRLMLEPRRLWRRYLFQNARFAWIVLRHWLSAPR